MVKWDLFHGCKDCSMSASKSTQHTTLTKRNMICSIDEKNSQNSMFIYD